MDLVDLMKSMSLDEDIQDSSASNFHVFAVNIAAVHTEIVYGEFVNKYMIIATQYGKVGGLIRVSIDQVENGFDSSTPVYSINSLFGAENIEQQAAARYIAEQLKIRKPLLLFLGLKSYSVETVKSVVEALLNLPDKDNKPQASS